MTNNSQKLSSMEYRQLYDLEHKQSCHPSLSLPGLEKLTYFQGKFHRFPNTLLSFYPQPKSLVLLSQRLYQREGYDHIQWSVPLHKVVPSMCRIELSQPIHQPMKDPGQYYSFRMSHKLFCQCILV